MFAHGGYALGAGDWEVLRPFREAGFAVLLPTFRGENGNQGSFEMCRGEVDDAAAAVDYLATRPEVDPKRLFAAGHSTGGTIAMLVAEVSPRLRRAAACGGYPCMALGGPYDGAPFDRRSAVELELRSPARWLADLRCPLLLLYGDDGGERAFMGQAQAMAEAAPGLSKQVMVEQFSGVDHFGALEPAVARMIRFFAAE